VSARSSRMLLTALVSAAAFWWLIASSPGQVASYGSWVLVALSATIVGLSSFESRLKRRRLFAGRNPVSPDQVLSDYFGPTGLDRDVVVGVWLEIARRLGVPADKLRPTDRFKVELVASGLFDVFDTRKDELARFADSYANREGRALDLTRVETVGELIEQMVGRGAPRA
jgi:hypothetical protein